MKLMNNMSIDSLTRMYEQQDFDDFQLNEIRVGLDRGVMYRFTQIVFIIGVKCK